MKIRIELEPTRWDSLSMRDRAKYIHQSILNHYANGGSMTDISIDGIRHLFEEGGQLVPSFNEWIKALAHAWDTTPEQVLDPKLYYDYVKYYEDNPLEAWNQIALFNLLRQRELTEEEKLKLHFPDSGESGTYKTLNHPTYPEMGYSWNENNTVFYPSERLFYMNNPEIPNETNTDRILDYLGRDLNYNKGASKAVYDKGIILPTTYITPRESYLVLERNPLDTGWQYKLEEYDNGGTLIHLYDEGGTTWMKPGQGYNFFLKLFKTKTYKNAINGNNASSVLETPSILEQPQTAQLNTAPTYDNSRFYLNVNLADPDFIEKTLPLVKNDLRPFVEDYFTRLLKYHPDIDINKGWEIFNNMPFNIENGLESEHVRLVNGMYGKGAYATGSYHSPSKSMTYYHYGDDPRSITQYGSFLNSVAHEYSHAFRDLLLGGVNEMSKEELEILDRGLPRLNVISPLRNAEGSATISLFRNHLGTKYGVYGQIFNDYLNGLSDSDLLDLFSDENAYVKGITPEYLASIEIDPEEYELAEMTWNALNAKIKKNIEAGIQTDLRVLDALDRALDYLSELDAIKSGNYPNYDKSKINALRLALKLIAENNSSKSNAMPLSFISANGGTLIHQYDGTSEDTLLMYTKEEAYNNWKSAFMHYGKDDDRTIEWKNYYDRLNNTPLNGGTLPEITVTPVSAYNNRKQYYKDLGFLDTEASIKAKYDTGASDELVTSLEYPTLFLVGQHMKTGADAVGLTASLVNPTIGGLYYGSTGAYEASKGNYDNAIQRGTMAVLPGIIGEGAKGINALTGIAPEITHGLIGGYFSGEAANDLYTNGFNPESAAMLMLSSATMKTPSTMSKKAPSIDKSSKNTASSSRTTKTDTPKVNFIETSSGNVITPEAFQKLYLNESEPLFKNLKELLDYSDLRIAQLLDMYKQAVDISELYSQYMTALNEKDLKTILNDIIKEYTDLSLKEKYYTSVINFDVDNVRGFGSQYGFSRDPKAADALYEEVKASPEFLALEQKVVELETLRDKHTDPYTKKDLQQLINTIRKHLRLLINLAMHTPELFTVQQNWTAEGPTPGDRSASLRQHINESNIVDVWEHPNVRGFFDPSSEMRTSEVLDGTMGGYMDWYEKDVIPRLKKSATNIFDTDKAKHAFDNLVLKILKVPDDANLGGWANSDEINVIASKFGLDPNTFVHELHHYLRRLMPKIETAGYSGASDGRVGNSQLIPSKFAAPEDQLVWSLYPTGYNRAEAKALDKAYEFTQSYIDEHSISPIDEKGATNTEIRYNIASKYAKDGVPLHGEELDKKIDSLTDEELFENGFMRGEYVKFGSDNTPTNGYLKNFLENAVDKYNKLLESQNKEPIDNVSDEGFRKYFYETYMPYIRLALKYVGSAMIGGSTLLMQNNEEES